MPRQVKAGPGLPEAEHQIGIPWQNDQGQWWVRRPGDGKAVRWSPGFLQGAAVGGDHPRGPGPRVANPSYPVLRFFERLKHNFKRLFGRHSISPVPRACKIHADKPARQALHKLVGRKVSDAEIAMLACAPDGADVDVRCDPAGGRITISMNAGDTRGPRLDTMRVLQRDRDGTLFCENELFETEHLPPGVGTELFYRQVQALLTLGVRYIDTQAAGAPGDRHHNGYYTWPRCGYSGFLSRLTLDRLPPNLQQQMGSSNDVLDLMKTPEGRDWWKANGYGLDCTFDLTPGSRNLQTLVAYLQERRQAVAAGARRRGSLPRHGKAFPGHVRGLARRMRDDWNHEAYLQPLADALEQLGATRLAAAVRAGADPDASSPDGANALDVMEAILGNDEYLIPLGPARLEFARFKALALWRSKGLRPPLLGSKAGPKRPEGDYFRGRGNRWFRRVRTPGGNVRTVPAKAPPAGPSGPVTAGPEGYRPGVARMVTGRGYDQEDIPDAAPRLPEPEATHYHPPPAPRSSYEVGPQDVIPTPQPSAPPGVASTLRRLYGSRDASRTVADLPDSEQLQQATVVPRVWDTGSLHEAHLKKLKLGDREYFFKGMTAERDARDSDESRRRLAAAQERAGREAVMSELAEVAGIPALPIRVVEFQGRRGVLADWSEWPTVNDLANHTGKTARQIVQQDLPGATRMLIFNLLTLASDKHDGNYLVNDQGQLVSLDNEFSLGVVYAFRRDDRAWDWSDMETDICYKCLEYMRQPLNRSVLSEVLDRAEDMAVHLEQTGQSSKAAGLRQRHAILQKYLIDRPTRDGMATTIFDVKDAGQEIAGHQAVAAGGLLQSTEPPQYSVGPSDVVPSGEAVPSDIPEVVLPESVARLNRVEQFRPSDFHF